MDILERINIALDGPMLVEDDVQQAAKTVDMTNQYERKKALEDCKGPCIGWEDYAAGNDYVPPMFWAAKSTQPYGPKDTGRAGITTPKEYEQLTFDGPSPHSVKYGGVRPWAPGEVLETLMYKSDEDGLRGKLYEVAKKGVVDRAARAAHGKYDEDDVEDSVLRGASAVLLELPNDEAQDGTRFTSFIGSAIQQAMKAGVPPGFGDEYRRTRGLKRKMLPIISSALKNAKNGESLNNSVAELNKLYQNFNTCIRCKGSGEVVDPRNRTRMMHCKRCGGNGEVVEPGPRHKYGSLAVQLLEVRKELIRAMKTGSMKNIQQAADFATEKFDDIENSEQIHTDLGVASQGAVGRKPREHGTLIAFDRAAKLLGQQRELAAEGIRLLERGSPSKPLIATSEQLWKSFKTTSPGRHKTKLAEAIDLAIAEADEIDTPVIEPTQKGKRGVYVSKFEKRMEDLPGSPGFIGLLAMKERLEEALRSNDKSKLEEFIKMSNLEQDNLKVREELDVRGIGAKGLTVQNKLGKEKERTGFARQERAVDALRSERNKEILYKALMRVSPFQDDTLERKERATEASTVLSAINTAIIEYVEARSENADTTKAKSDLMNISRGLNSNLGEWKDEIESLLGDITDIVENGGGFSSVRQEIADLQKIAKQDMKLKPSDEAMSPQQYRLALRQFGVDDYPERGTPKDPEIDENGAPSRWAKAGYPPIAGAAIGKPQTLPLWVDVFDKMVYPDGPDKPGKHAMSVSGAYLSRQKNEAKAKFIAAAQELERQVVECFGFDSVERTMIAEFNLLLCRMIVEEVLPDATRLIYG
jgi:hypothetical protein